MLGGVEIRSPSRMTYSLVSVYGRAYSIASEKNKYGNSSEKRDCVWPVDFNFHLC